MRAPPRPSLLHDEEGWDAELAIVAGRIDLLLDRARAAGSIAARRFALDALARGLLFADPGAVDEATREAARALRVDPSTIAAASAPALPHAVPVPLVATERGVAFVRQVHVTFDPAGGMRDGLLDPSATSAAASAIRAAAERVRPPSDPAAHVLTAAQPEVLRRARVEGRSLGAAAFVSAVSSWSGRAVRLGRVVTGAIAGDAVASVGAMDAKARAAHAHGASVLVVPAADAAAARAAARIPLEVVGVATLDELVDACLEPVSRAHLDPDRLAAEARALARTGWDGYRWPSLREGLARISGRLPNQRLDLRVEVLTQLAAAQRHSGDPLGCREVLAAAHALVASDEGRVAVPDPPIVALYRQTAMTERQLCHFGAAARAAARSVAVARRARLRGDLIKALGVVGLVALSRQRIDEAVEAFRESLALTLAHQPQHAARSRAYLIEALGEAGRAADVEAELEAALSEVATDRARESWVRTSGAAAMLCLGRPAEAVRLLEAPCVRASLAEEPLPGLLARRRLGLGLTRAGEPDRGFEVLAASPIVHGRALEAHLSFLAHVNVLYEALARVEAGAWTSDIAGRAHKALAHVPTYGGLPRFLGRALRQSARALERSSPPPGRAALTDLLRRCARLT